MRPGNHRFCAGIAIWEFSEDREFSVVREVSINLPNLFKRPKFSFRITTKLIFKSTIKKEVLTNIASTSSYKVSSTKIVSSQTLGRQPSHRSHEDLYHQG